MLLPIWHTPDEQAHFAQVAYFSEFGRMPGYAIKHDLNREIWMSEVLLDTERGKNGNNKYTYHPEYNIEYTSNYQGKYENQIASFPINYRQEFVKQESANYPPLFYWISSIFYKLFYHGDIFLRVYMVRVLSILMGIGLVGVSYLLSKELFKEKLTQITFCMMIGFHPMLSFLSSGVNSDNLFNLLFGLFIYLNILVIKYGFMKRTLGLVGLTFVLLYLTKPQFLLAIPILVLSVICSFVYRYKINWKRILKIVIPSVLLIVGILISLSYMKVVDFIESVYPQSFFPGRTNENVKITVIEFLNMTITKFLRETIPWYWGVFKWLSLVYPIEVIRVINRFLLLAGIGVLIYTYILIKNKLKKEAIIFFYLIVISVIYLSGIFYFDYLFTMSKGFSFGIQGRYLFPTILAHMAVLTVGFINLIPDKYYFLKEWWIKTLGLLMVILNFIALYVIANSYYDLTNINNFILQVSQYKPWFFKGNWVGVWLSLYLIALTTFLYFYIKTRFKQVLK